MDRLISINKYCQQYLNFFITTKKVPYSIFETHVYRTSYEDYKFKKFMQESLNRRVSKVEWGTFFFVLKECKHCWQYLFTFGDPFVFQCNKIRENTF
jgi:hypothetical protein